MAEEDITEPIIPQRPTIIRPGGSDGRVPIRVAPLPPGGASQDYDSAASNEESQPGDDNCKPQIGIRVLPQVPGQEGGPGPTGRPLPPRPSLREGEPIPVKVLPSTYSEGGEGIPATVKTPSTSSQEIAPPIAARTVPTRPSLEQEGAPPTALRAPPARPSADPDRPPRAMPDIPGGGSHALLPSRPAPPAPGRSSVTPNAHTYHPAKRPLPPPPSGPAGRRDEASKPQPKVAVRPRSNSGSKRSRPVITVVDAKPMDQVGFRDVTSNSGSQPQPNKPARKGAPEIIIVNARPMSEVSFRDVNSVSSNQSENTLATSSQSEDKPPLSPSGVHLGSEAVSAGEHHPPDHIYAEIKPKQRKEPPVRPKKPPPARPPSYRHSMPPTTGSPPPSYDEAIGACPAPLPTTTEAPRPRSQTSKPARPASMVTRPPRPRSTSLNASPNDSPDVATAWAPRRSPSDDAQNPDQRRAPPPKPASRPRSIAMGENLVISDSHMTEEGVDSCGAHGTESSRPPPPKRSLIGVQVLPIPMLTPKEAPPSHAEEEDQPTARDSPPRPAVRQRPSPSPRVATKPLVPPPARPRGPMKAFPLESDSVKTDDEKVAENTDTSSMGVQVLPLGTGKSMSSSLSMSDLKIKQNEEDLLTSEIEAKEAEPTITRKRPTIIRPSKSLSNIAMNENEPPKNEENNNESQKPKPELQRGVEKSNEEHESASNKPTIIMPRRLSSPKSYPSGSLMGRRIMSADFPLNKIPPDLPSTPPRGTPQLELQRKSSLERSPSYEAGAAEMKTGPTIIMPRRAVSMRNLAARPNPGNQEDKSEPIKEYKSEQNNVEEEQIVNHSREIKVVEVTEPNEDIKDNGLTEITNRVDEAKNTAGDRLETNKAKEEDSTPEPHKGDDCVKDSNSKVQEKTINAPGLKDSSHNPVNNTSGQHVKHDEESDREMIHEPEKLKTRPTIIRCTNVSENLGVHDREVESFHLKQVPVEGIKSEDEPLKGNSELAEKLSAQRQRNHSAEDSPPAATVGTQEQNAPPEEAPKKKVPPPVKAKPKPPALRPKPKVVVRSRPVSMPASVGPVKPHRYSGVTEEFLTIRSSTDLDVPSQQYVLSAALKSPEKTDKTDIPLEPTTGATWKSTEKENIDESKSGSVWSSKTSQPKMMLRNKPALKSEDVTKSKDHRKSQPPLLAARPAVIKTHMTPYLEKEDHALTELNVDVGSVSSISPRMSPGVSPKPSPKPATLRSPASSPGSGVTGSGVTGSGITGADASWGSIPKSQSWHSYQEETKKKPPPPLVRPKPLVSPKGSIKRNPVRPQSVPSLYSVVQQHVHDEAGAAGGADTSHDHDIAENLANEYKEEILKTEPAAQSPASRRSIYSVIKDQVSRSPSRSPAPRSPAMSPRGSPSQGSPSKITPPKTSPKRTLFQTRPQSGIVGVSGEELSDALSKSIYSPSTSGAGSKMNDSFDVLSSDYKTPPKVMPKKRPVAARQPPYFDDGPDQEIITEQVENREEDKMFEKTPPESHSGINQTDIPVIPGVLPENQYEAVWKAHSGEAQRESDSRDAQQVESYSEPPQAKLDIQTIATGMDSSGVSPDTKPLSTVSDTSKSIQRTEPEGSDEKMISGDDLSHVQLQNYKSSEPDNKYVEIQPDGPKEETEHSQESMGPPERPKVAARVEAFASTTGEAESRAPRPRPQRPARSPVIDTSPPPTGTAAKETLPPYAEEKISASRPQKPARSPMTDTSTPAIGTATKEIMPQNAEEKMPTSHPQRPARSPVPDTSPPPTSTATKEILPQNAEEKMPTSHPQRPARSPVPDTSPPPTSTAVKETLPPSGAEEKVPKSRPQRPPASKARPPRPVSGPMKAVHSIQSTVEQSESSSKKPAPSRPSAPTRPGRPVAVTRSTRAHSMPVGPPELPSRPGPGHPLFHYVVNEPYGIAMYDFEATQPDELSFKIGDVLLLDSYFSADWLRGRNGDQSGIFPANFVDIVKAPSAKPETLPSVASTSPAFSAGPAVVADTGHGPRCVARFDYEGDGEEDLKFVSGDIIKLTRRIGEDWLEGEMNASTGMFPLAFVEILEDLPQDAPDGAIKIGRGLEVTAMFDFNGEEDELSFKIGNTITVLSSVSADWLYGEMGGKRGTFPATFVDRVPEALPVYSTSEGHGNEGTVVKETENETCAKTPKDSQNARVVNLSEKRYCIAKFAYQGTGEDLDFDPGERIEVTGRVDNAWLRGRLAGKEGIFPAQFVEMEIVFPALAEALYDYESQDDNDLSFKIGDKITVLEKISDDWMKGQLNGKTGTFPSAFVNVNFLPPESQA